MSNGVKHPYTGAIYEQSGDGHIVVTKPDGTSGLFHRDGRWISGDVRECDAQVCGWVGGPRVGNHRLTPSTQGI